jgi:dipeptidyl aminopeptidase/acylaminoacyl peptidase
VKFWAYIFIPQKLNKNKKYPLLVLPHGGVHADFTTYHTHIIREMMAQGYIVVAPEYRGSTEYGQDFFEQIDYGGREVEDNKAARDWMIENCKFVDSTRIGAIDGVMEDSLRCSIFSNIRMIIKLLLPVYL